MLAFGALAVAGCGSGGNASSPTASPAATTSAATTPAASSSGAKATDAVTIRNYSFAPVTTTVAAGTKVTWTNEDPSPHTATSTSAGAFDTGTLHKGQSKTITLSKPGTYSYYCQLHPFMKATIVVH
jgi:plastocyanin